jgi:hypothetical protein
MEHGSDGAGIIPAAGKHPCIRPWKGVHDFSHAAWDRAGNVPHRVRVGLGTQYRRTSQAGQKQTGGALKSVVPQNGQISSSAGTTASRRAR